MSSTSESDGIKLDKAAIHKNTAKWGLAKLSTRSGAS